ncbi:RNA recognition motif domain-containing protein [Ditylenchus destructor]|nr:RNA recognition motif domain-containing protein [Ditylenchus destructor]
MLISQEQEGKPAAFAARQNFPSIGRSSSLDGWQIGNTPQKGQQFSVYVTGLPKDTTDEVLCETFSKVGKPVHWEVKRDWKTNRSLGYAYVVFSSAEEVDRVMDGRPYSIYGQEVTVKRRLQRKEETIKN